MDAADIIKKLAERYVSCASYEDSGTVETFPDAGGSGKQDFRTYFAKPNKFRFEWLTYHQLGKTRRARFNIVWSDGNQAYELFESQESEQENDFRGAIASASTFSQGAIVLVPALLMQEVAVLIRKSVTQLDYLHRLDDSDNLFHLQGSSRLSNDTELWIDRGFILRRVKERFEPHDAKFEGDRVRFVEHRYDSVHFDRPIPDSIFRFEDRALEVPEEQSQKLR